MRSLAGGRPSQPALPADVLRADPAPPGHARRPPRRERFGAPISLVGSRYAYRERLVRELADYPLRVWGGGWTQADDPAVRAAGGRAAGVRVRQALRVRGLDAVAEPAPSDERHRRREHAGLRAGRRRRLPGGGLQGGSGHALQAGRGGRSSTATSASSGARSTSTWPARTRHAPSARTRDAARWPSTRCATGSRRCCASSASSSADDRVPRPPAGLHRLRRHLPARLRPRVREVPRSARARLRSRSPAPRRPLGAQRQRPLALRGGAADRRSGAPADARRGRHAAAGGAHPGRPPRRTTAALEVRGRESDRDREGSLVGHGRRRRAAVRLPRHVGRVLRQCRLLDRGLLGARRAPLADLRLRAHLGAQAPAHGRHHARPRPLPGRATTT